MASAFAHAAAGAALAYALQPRGAPRYLPALGAALAVAPDVDVLAFRFGVPYESMLGHRGITHALLPAALAALLGAWALTRRGGDGEHPSPKNERTRLWLALFVATASHGVLDALTTGGLGVAFLAPLSGERFFFPWRPILVSPIGARRFFTARGVAVLANEAAWVGLPSLVLWMLTRARRARR